MGTRTRKQPTERDLGEAKAMFLRRYMSLTRRTIPA